MTFVNVKIVVINDGRVIPLLKTNFSMIDVFILRSLLPGVLEIVYAICS